MLELFHEKFAAKIRHFYGNGQKFCSKTAILLKHLVFLHHSSNIWRIMSGIYIHIPFCARRCVYCGFFSTTHDALRSAYVRAVVSELGLRRTYLGDSDVSTIYIGGGTPSHLAFDDLSLLLRSVLEAAPHPAEVTVENTE